MRNGVVGHKLHFSPVLESARLKCQGLLTRGKDALGKVMRVSSPSRNIHRPIEYVPIRPFVRNEVLSSLNALATELASEHDGTVKQGDHIWMTRQFLRVQLHWQPHIDHIARMPNAIQFDIPPG